MTTKVLKIIGDVDINLNLPEDTEIVKVKLDDYMINEYEERFDMIFCIHALQTLWAHQVDDAISKLVGDLKSGGELHIHVPATEHAAKTIIKSDTDPIAMYLIWGTPDRPFHTGFTLFWLRSLIEQKKCIIRQASVGLFGFDYMGKEVRAPEHVCIATIDRN